MILTISIVAVGDQPLLLDCLESIGAQTTVEHEIYLVDNPASSAFLSEVTRRFPQVKLMHSPSLRSFSANNNEVQRCSSAEFVLLLYDDTVILDHALDRMVEFLASQPKETGIVGCANLDDWGSLTLSCFPFPTAGVTIWQHAHLGHWLPGRVYERYLPLARGSEPFPVDWVKGSCMLIRREVIQQIGCLDEGFFLFCEEIDYCYRAQQAGFSAYQVPEARILHYESTTTSRFVPIKLRGHHLGKLYFLPKHGFNRDLNLARTRFIVELLAKSMIRSMGALVEGPPGSRERLQTYLELLRICATYRRQPASTFVKSE